MMITRCIISFNLIVAVFVGLKKDCSMNIISPVGHIQVKNLMRRSVPHIGLSIESLHTNMSIYK